MAGLLAEVPIQSMLFSKSGFSMQADAMMQIKMTTFAATPKIDIFEIASMDLRQQSG